MKKVTSHPRSVLVALLLASLSVSLQSCGKSLLPLGPTLTGDALLHAHSERDSFADRDFAPTEWPLVVSETFDEQNTSWPVGDINNDYAKGKVAVMGGKYYIKLTAKKAMVWDNIPVMDDLTDAYATVKVDQRSGAKTAEYGLILGDNPSTQYFFSISTIEQGYEFAKYSDKTWSTMTLWTNSSRILVGEPDQIGVKVEGIQIHFLYQRRAGRRRQGSRVHREGKWGSGFSYTRPETRSKSRLTISKCGSRRNRVRNAPQPVFFPKEKSNSAGVSPADFLRRRAGERA